MFQHSPALNKKKKATENRWQNGTGMPHVVCSTVSVHGRLYRVLITIRVTKGALLHVDTHEHTAEGEADTAGHGQEATPEGRLCWSAVAQSAISTVNSKKTGSPVGLRRPQGHCCRKPPPPRPSSNEAQCTGVAVSGSSPHGHNDAERRDGGGGALAACNRSSEDNVALEQCLV